MLCRYHLCMVVLAAGSLMLAGCGTAGPKPKTSWHAAGGSNATPAEHSASSATAMDKLAEAHAHYAAGVVHELNDEAKLALAEFSQAALDDPDNESLVLDVSRKFLMRRQPEQALALLTNTTARVSASGAIYARMGMIYSQLGKTDLAIEANRTAIRKQPRSLAGYHNLFLTYLQNSRQEDAFEVLHQASKQPDTSAEFLINLAELFGEYARQAPTRKGAADSEALSALNRAAKLKPADVGLRLKLADGFYALGQTAKASPIYLELLKRPGIESEASLLRTAIRAKLADIYLRGQDRARAAEQLEGIVRDDPTNPQGYYYLGSIAFEERRMTNAVEYFAKTILLDPDFEQAYYDLASAHLNLNQTGNALATLEKARAKFADNFVAQFLNGMTYSRRKEYSQAIKHFTAAEVIARATQPKRLNHVFFQLGSACERNGDVSQAEEYFKKCLELAPDFAEAMNYLGYMWVERGVNLDRARELIEKAVKVEPRNAAFLDSLGWVLFKLNQPKAALKQLLISVECAEEPDATIYDHLGDVHAALNQKEKAREAWRKSLNLEPNEQVRKKLEGVPVK